MPLVSNGTKREDRSLCVSTTIIQVITRIYLTGNRKVFLRQSRWSTAPGWGTTAPDVRGAALEDFRDEESLSLVLGDRQSNGLGPTWGSIDRPPGSFLDLHHILSPILRNETDSGSQPRRVGSFNGTTAVPTSRSANQSL